MKDKKIIFGITLAFIFLASIGFSYAYFSIAITNKDVKDQVVETGTLQLTYTDGPEINIQNMKPGNTITKTITVKNTGSLEAKYNIIWQELTNEITNNEMLIEGTCTRINGATEEVDGTCENIVSTPINSLKIKSKVLKRDREYMVYVKSSENISDFIKYLGAFNALFYFEDIRIYKDHKNMVNRLNNCEQANVERTLKSSKVILDNINYLEDNDLLMLLDDRSKEIIEYKKKYPDTSLGELAEIITMETNKSITKSGINHHFRKINALVKKAKENHE